MELSDVLVQIPMGAVMFVSDITSPTISASVFTFVSFVVIHFSLFYIAGDELEPTVQKSLGIAALLLAFQVAFVAITKSMGIPADAFLVAKWTIRVGFSRATHRSCEDSAVVRVPNGDEIPVVAD